MEKRVFIVVLFLFASLGCASTRLAAIDPHADESQAVVADEKAGDPLLDDPNKVKGYPDELCDDPVC